MKMQLSSQHPMICVPIVAKYKKDIIEQVKVLVKHNIRCIEWRMDYFDQVCFVEEVLEVLKEIRPYLKDTLLIATFRTKEEGGIRSIQTEDYYDLLYAIDQSKLVDYIDVEGYSKPAIYIRLRSHAKTKYIVSYHNFACIPNELTQILKNMQALHAEVIKVACMPTKVEDKFLFKETIDSFIGCYDGLFIAILMGVFGVETRIDPCRYHSCLTFASLKETSAPGQISYEELR